MARARSTKSKGKSNTVFLGVIPTGSSQKTAYLTDNTTGKALEKSPARPITGFGNTVDTTLLSPALNDHVESTISVTITTDIVIDNLFMSGAVQINTGCDCTISVLLNNQVLFKARWRQNIGAGGSPDASLFQIFSPYEEKTLIPKDSVLSYKVETDINGAGNSIRILGAFGIAGTVL